MIGRHFQVAAYQKGIALITSLLLLLVVTILAVAMFRGYGIQGKIAGNVREKERALHAAESAQQYAEWWLTQSNNSATPPTTCAATLDANLGQGQICSNVLSTAVQPGKITSLLPWQDSSGNQLGVTYLPLDMTASASSPAQNSYYKKPTFYISDLGVSADAQGEIYQIDAVGYGANPSSVAVVESTFAVQSGVVCRSC